MRQEFLQLGQHAFAAQEQPQRSLLIDLGGRGENLRPDASGLLADALRQGDEILFFGADFDESPAKEGDIGQVFLFEAMQIEARVQVDDAVGEEVMVEGRDSFFLQQHLGNELVGSVQIRNFQGRNRLRGLPVSRAVPEAF